MRLSLARSTYPNWRMTLEASLPDDTEQLRELDQWLDAYGIGLGVPYEKPRGLLIRMTVEPDLAMAMRLRWNVPLN